MMQIDCKLQYYYIDCIIDIDDFNTPITYFIDSMFLQLNPQLYIKKNIFYWVGTSEIKDEVKTEDNVVDDIYKEASELEYNKVSEEIIDSMKNQQKRDIKLIKNLDKKINGYNN